MNEENNLTEEQEVKRWHERISLAQKANESWIQESRADTIVAEYSGKYQIALKEGQSPITVPPINMVFAYVQSDIAMTSHRNPYIAVNPSNKGTIQGAKMLEAWMNYQWRELKIKEETDLEIMDKDLVGCGWHKVCFTPQTEGSGPQTQIVKDKLSSQYVFYKNIFWNIGAKRIPQDCIWMAEKISKPLAYWKKTYANAKMMKGTQHIDVNDKDYKSVQFKDDIEFGTAYEIWDTESKRVLLIAEGINDKYLSVKEWPEYLDEFPYLHYWDYAVPNKARPMSAIAPWEMQILEEMVILAQAVNHVKRWNRQVFVRQGSVDPNSLDKYERGDDGAIIEVAGTGNLRENIMFVDFGQLPTDFYSLMDRIRAAGRLVSGMPEFEQGGVTKTQSRTFRELLLVKEGAKSRHDRKVTRYEEHIKDIARHMLAHFKANFDGEQIVKVTGETPETVLHAFGKNYDQITRTLQFSVDEIVGEYDVDIAPGSTLPLSKETRMEVLDNVLEKLGPAINAGIRSPFIKALVTEILSEFNIKGLEEAWELEKQMLMAEQQQMARDSRMKSAKSAAQAEKTVAQAGKIDSETAKIEEDIKNAGMAGRASSAHQVAQAEKVMADANKTDAETAKIEEEIRRPEPVGAK